MCIVSKTQDTLPLTATMTLRFVKTSILSSSDGIDFGTEIAVESDEVRKTRVAAEAAGNKPLYEQLADIRDRKKLEYDENTKKIFAPPKGLDEEDIDFFNEMDDAKARADDQNKRLVNAELEAFRESRRIELLKEPQELPHATFNIIPPKKVEPALKVGVVVTGMRILSASFKWIQEPNAIFLCFEQPSVKYKTEIKKTVMLRAKHRKARL